MPPNEIIQEGNTVTGGIAARDINNTTNILPEPTKNETSLSRLYRDLNSKADGDEILTDYIRQLKIFTRVVHNETVIGVEAKLTAANRVDQVDMALHMKEMIYAQLRENLFSRVFQLIYANLMGKTFEEFQRWVKPAIDAGEPREAVDEIVYSKVIRPIAAELDECEGCYDPPSQTVRGMVYFLTGNCHIKWS